MRTSGEVMRPGSTALVLQTFDARQANRFRQTIRVLCAQEKGEHAIRAGGIFDRELRDRAILVFDFHRQIVGLEKRLCARQDFGQAAGQEAVTYVVGHHACNRQIEER